MSRTVLCGLTTAPVLLIAAPMAMAAPLSPFLFADQARDQVMLAVDRNSDGDANDPGESRVFFDTANASGLDAPTTNVFSLNKSSDGSVLVGDGATDTVFRVRDADGDFTANGAGEAAVWFSGSANASGFRLNTPNGIAEGPDGAVYIVEADTVGSPTGDYVYRTVDRNGDGDANDAGEATAWLDLKAINAASSPFTIRFDGATAFVMDTAGATPNVIYRAADTNGDQVIGAGEVSVFASDDAAFGATFDFAMAVTGGAVWTWDWLADTVGVSRVFRLTDLNGSGVIDAANEVAEAWNTTLLDPAYTFLAGFTMDANRATGEILIASNDGDANGDWVIRLLDLDGDGLFLSKDEASVVLDRLAQGTYPDRPRDVAFYAGAVPAPVPLPAALPLMGAALGAYGLLAVRRRLAGA